MWYISDHSCYIIYHMMYIESPTGTWNCFKHIHISRRLVWINGA